MNLGIKEALNKPKRKKPSLKQVHCLKCSSEHVIKKGFYTRKRNRQKIQKYQCLDCKTCFSVQSFQKDYRQKKPDLNQQILEAASSGMGVRRLAKNLRTTKNTIQRKILFLGLETDNFQQEHEDEWTTFKPRFQMDEMETFENRKTNTVKIPVIVERESYFIVSMKALRDKSRSYKQCGRDYYNNKHSNEINQKNKDMEDLMLSCTKMKKEGRIVVETDKFSTYPAILKSSIGDRLVHVKYDAKKETDKLFPINNTMACMRDDVALLRRRSWHGFKSLK